MNFITPIPSQVNRRFWDTYDKSPQQAVADFYDLSKRNDYIKIAAIAKNIAFTTPSQYGDIQITINLSKPEKDPKAIAAAKLTKASSYPKCQLCMENEGYQGRINHPARANHRIIRLNLGDEKWGFQYSPYAYFNEHCIIALGKFGRNNLKSLTVDRGKEFAGYLELENKLDLDVYFADAYSSWQRGTNENTNGLIREFFPKKFDFSTINQNHVDIVEDILNNRPRKCLGYKTPLEAFNEEQAKCCT